MMMMRGNNDEAHQKKKKKSSHLRFVLRQDLQWHCSLSLRFPTMMMMMVPPGTMARVVYCSTVSPIKWNSVAWLELNPIRRIPYKVWSISCILYYISDSTYLFIMTPVLLERVTSCSQMSLRETRKKGKPVILLFGTKDWQTGTIMGHVHCSFVRSTWEWYMTPVQQHERPLSQMFPFYL